MFFFFISENTDEAISKDIEICISQFTQTLEENLASFIDVTSLIDYTKKGRQPAEKPIFKCGECGKIFQLKHHLQVKCILVNESDFIMSASNDPEVYV